MKLTVPEGLPEREVTAPSSPDQGWLMTKLAPFSGESELEDGGTHPCSRRRAPHRENGRLRRLTEALVIGEEAVSQSGRCRGASAPAHRRLSQEGSPQRTRTPGRVLCRQDGKQARSLSLKDTRSRWGSCSAEGDLSFSWRIAMAPPKVIAYLAAHEVAHLQEMNHGPRFWALMREPVPGNEGRQALAQAHGTMLHAIDFG